jgi:hypothetical protein
MPPSNSSTLATTPTLARSSGQQSPPPARWSSDWRESLGAGWQFQIALIGLCLFAAGAFQPLAEPDLPIHLAAGEWVVRHHGVPRVEPWAWTRQGAPFQAYSWGIETAYYLILSKLGPWGLHVLQGLVYVGLAAVIAVLGRVARWSVWTTVVVAGVQLLVVTGADPYLRPQAILAIVTPLVWALVLRARDAERLRWELAGLLFLSAVVANGHLLIPILLAPCAVLFTQEPRVSSRRIVVPAAIVFGWLLTPYAFDWVSIYRLNFSPNAMVNPPSILAEYKPGFTLALRGGFTSLLIPVALLALPWLTAGRLRKSERVLYGTLWLGGGLLFALAARAILVWWLVVIPLAAVAVEPIARPTLRSLRLVQPVALAGLCLAFALHGIGRFRDALYLEGSPSWRTLPSLNARSMEPIAVWLDCSVRSDARGRLVTTFGFGGYIPWRLPYLSESIDGRGIFPDSVAKAETYFFPALGKPPIQPWRTADLAIAPTGYPLAAILDTALGWRRVATTEPSETGSSVGLWVTARWWNAAGGIDLPPRSITLTQRSGQGARDGCRG